MSEVRLGAVSAVAERFGVTEETIADAFIRQLRPQIASTSDFDEAVDDWFKGKSDRLKIALLSHISSDEPQQDADAIAGLIGYVEGK